MTDETRTPPRPENHPYYPRLSPPALPDGVSLAAAAESLSRAALFAEPALTPRAMRQMMEKPLGGGGDVPALDGTSGTETLARQAQVLDILFHRLVVKALSSPYKNHDSASAAYVDDARLDLALRAQRQCRNTLGTVQLMKIMGARGKNFDEQKEGH